MKSSSPFLDNSKIVTESIKKMPVIPDEKLKPSYTGKIVPVTLITGYLGAGKTTIITNVIKNVSKDYKIAWLKNEIGNTAVDSELAKQENVATVKEILKGCLCHYMIGSLNSALEEMLQSNPDRIIIETSGSAAPAPIVWEIRDNPHFHIDGVITVIDAINFNGYVNKSHALKMQAKYTDLILINKHEDLDENILEKNLDDLYEINLDTPKIKTQRGFVPHDILFGLDSTLFLTEESVAEEERHYLDNHQELEVELIEIEPTEEFIQENLQEILDVFPKKNFYRIKGVVKNNKKMIIINYAFGKTTFKNIDHDTNPRIVFMGEDLKNFTKQIAAAFKVSENDVKYTPKGHHHDHH